jgi:outer membrane protein TolC
MKASKLLIVPWLLSSSYLVANEQNLKYDAYISDYKQKEFLYDYKKNEQESLKLRDSWIAPIQLDYSYSRSNPYIGEQISENASVRMNQPIFRSGGIYYGIKFAGASRLFSDYTTDSLKRKMIKDTIATLFQIKQYELFEQKQKLQIANAEINLEQKKEEYLSGQLDSGFLDDAIIQKNVVTQAMYDIETTKEKLIATFHSLSDLDYKTAKLPRLELISQDEFLKNNIALKLSDVTVEKNRYAKNVTVASYLPNVSFNASYNWNKKENQQFSATIPPNSEENAYYSYGFSVSMPLDFNSFRDVESAKVDYLKSKVLLLDKKRELEALFVQVMQNIKNYDKKIALSHENMKLYAKLLSDTEELYSAGYKTEYDVNTLKNSLAIQELDTKIYEIDKQLELLTLYEMYMKANVEGEYK